MIKLCGPQEGASGLIPSSIWGRYEGWKVWTPAYLENDSSSQHAGFESCHVVFLVYFKALPWNILSWIKWMFCNTFQIRFSIEQLIFRILKFINRWNNKCSDVFAFLWKMNSLLWIIPKYFCPVHCQFNTCLLKVGSNDCWGAKNRPQVMNDTSAIITLCNNINDDIAIVTAVIAGRVWTLIFVDGYLIKNKTIKNNELLKWTVIFVIIIIITSDW